MERKGSARSTTSTVSRRKRSAKMIRYSGQALAHFILIAAGVFIALACLGVSVQAYRYIKGNTPAVFPKATTTREPATPESESLSSHAFAATVTAVRLWGKLIMSILIPTTEHSLVYAKEGWSALAPSLKQSVMWFVYETPATFKLGIALGLLTLFILWLLEREIKRRRIVERIQNRVKMVTDRINAVRDGISRRYQIVRAEVERESRIAAQLLPHMLYLCAVIAIIYLFPELVQQFSRGFGAWSLVIAWPVLLSAQKLIQYDEVHRRRLKKLAPDNQDLSSSESDAEEEDGASAAGASDAQTATVTSPSAVKAQAYMETMVQFVRRRLLSDASISSTNVSLSLSAENVGDFDPIGLWLRYWSVLAGCLFFEQFPFTGHFLSVVPLWPELRLAFALWLQLPFTRGCDLAFTAVVPFLDKYVKKIPALQAAQDRLGATSLVEQRSMLITVLSSVGLVSKSTGKKLLKATEMNASLIMMAVPFMLSPSFITKIGVLVVGLAFPAHASTTAVLELDQFKRHAKRTDSEEAPAHADAGEQSVFWLEYWIVYVLFSLVHAPLATVFGWWFPLWDQFHLAVLLWMQVSYFSGAHNIFKIAVVIGRVFRRRRRAATRARRRRASSVASPGEKIEGIVGAIPLLSPLLGRVVAMSDSHQPRLSEEDDQRSISPAHDEDAQTDTEGDDKKNLVNEASVRLADSDYSPRIESERRDSEATIDREMGRKRESIEALDIDSKPSAPVATEATGPEEGSPTSYDDFVAVEADADALTEAET